MADDQQEDGLSEEEYDALLRDLESRAGGDGGGGGAEAEVDSDEDLGDIDDFLESVETESSKESKTATAEREDDDLAAEFAALEEEGALAEPEESEPAAPPKQAEGEEPQQEPSEADDEAQREAEEPSRVRRVGMAVLKNVLWFLPAMVLVWVVGFYLAQWVSAGWLIVAMSALVVFGLPALVRNLVDRGGYRPWMLGISLAAIVGLVAPMPNTAAERMSHYGHWPASTVAEISGAQPDMGYVNASASASAWLGQQLATVDRPMPQARQLGTIFPLDMEWPPEEGLEALDEPPQDEEALEAEQLEEPPEVQQQSDGIEDGDEL